MFAMASWERGLSAPGRSKVGAIAVMTRNCMRLADTAQTFVDKAVDELDYPRYGANNTDNCGTLPVMMQHGIHAQALAGV